VRDMVLVLNFDDEASRAVTRKLRSEKVYCKIVPGDISLEDIQAQEPLGLLLAGGTSGQCPVRLDYRIPQSGIPVLGLGDAAVMLLSRLGGTAGETVFQGAVIGLTYKPSPLLSGIEDGERMLSCAKELHLSPQTVPLCYAQEIIVGFAHESRPVYGMQFQVEQNDPDGSMMLRNFALNICGCTTWWDEDAFITRAQEEISRVVGQGRAVCALTGGLASGVSALLAHKALGRNLKCVFVDTGLLREREGDDFIAFFRDTVGMDITRVYAQDRFLEALRGIVKPEEKRRAIGRLLHTILQEEQEKLGDFDVVIRGTSCTDLMFSKGQEIPALTGKGSSVEPVRELFHDEIRRIADFLGIPAELTGRQPFPGSGLALRIMGEATPERVRTLRAADAVFRSELQRSSAAKKLWQYFAVLWPMPGDEKNVMICLRAVYSSERTQAYAARLPYDVMENVVELILRDQKNVCRVVYDLSPSSNYSGIEWQ